LADGKAQPFFGHVQRITDDACQASQADVPTLVELLRWAWARVQYVHRDARLEDARPLLRELEGHLNELAYKAMEKWRRMAELVIFIAGKPIAKGSAKWIKSASTGKSVPAKNAPLDEWKARVSHEGRAAFVAAFGEEAPLWNVALHLEADFVFERPKSHYKGGDRERGILKSLLRCVEDALQGIIYCDDALICGGPVNKRYGPVPGAQIWLYRLEKQRD
jgi:hypothetical protein